MVGEIAGIVLHEEEIHAGLHVPPVNGPDQALVLDVLWEVEFNILEH